MSASQCPFYAKLDLCWEVMNHLVFSLSQVVLWINFDGSLCLSLKIQVIITLICFPQKRVGVIDRLTSLSCVK